LKKRGEEKKNLLFRHEKGKKKGRWTGSIVERGETLTKSTKKGKRLSTRLIPSGKGGVGGGCGKGGGRLASLSGKREGLTGGRSPERRGGGGGGGGGVMEKKGKKSFKQCQKKKGVLK